MRTDIKSYLLFFIILTGLLFIFSLYHRQPHIDDAWIGEHAYWLEKDGIAKSELMHGVTLQEERLVVHHKFLVYQGAVLISLFGFSLYTLKSLSLIYFIFFLFIFYYYTYKKLLNRNEFLFAVLLILSNAFFFEYAFVYRPEIPVMTLGFLSYIFIEKALNKNIYAGWYVALAGFLSGLSISTHLNGIIFLIAGFILLLWNRKLIFGVIFAASSLPSLFIYFADMLSVDKLHLWYFQMFSSPSVDSSNILTDTLPFLFNRILKTLMLFLHSPKEISFSILMISIILLSFKHLKQFSNLLRYTFLLVVLLAFLAVHTSSKYMLLYMPYLVIIGTMALRFIYDDKKALLFCHSEKRRKTARLIVTWIIPIYFSIQMVYNVMMTYDKFDKSIHHELISHYVKDPAADLHIVAPMIYIFDEIKTFGRIQSDLCYVELSKADSLVYQRGFLKLADSFDTDYLFLRKRYIAHFGIDLMTDDEIFNNQYEVLLRSEDLIILKKIQDLE
jgi:hypothetical protein